MSDMFHVRKKPKRAFTEDVLRALRAYRSSLIYVQPSPTLASTITIIDSCINHLTNNYLKH